VEGSSSPTLSSLLLNPARAVLLGFAALITVGTLLLMTPLASAAGRSTDWLTALFTATSAACVTGLVTVDTGTHWSTFGQWTILGLIQAGGLGVMTLGSLMILLIGRRLGVQATMLTAAESRTLGAHEVRTVVLGILRITLVIEGATALLLAARFRLGYGEPFLEALWDGFFHSVSSFNNAGFGLRADSLVAYASDPWINVPVMVAVITGGIGFPVMWEVGRNLRRRADRRWSIHTVITLWASGILLVGGAVVLTVVEWSNPRTLGALEPGGRLLAGTFHSVVARTAGFNSIDIGAMNPEGLLTLDVLMFIGGGSAGTAGGVKVTTFALLAFVIWAELRGERTVHVLRRRLPQDVQRQALTIALLSVAAVVSSTAVLLELSSHTLDEVFFEAISAFATVGLSTGITADLPPAAQLVLVTLMFFGRLGPLTLGAALALRSRPRRYDFPEERAIVG
jgi:potassium uptake TrkH family protein